ncbi:hypothetical protein GIHI108528_07385 [Gillisia hiemivivida]
MRSEVSGLWFENKKSYRYIYPFQFIAEMAKKGAQKNTQNKAKHTKLINRKKNKLRKEKEAHKERLKAIVNKAKEQKNNDINI